MEKQYKEYEIRTLLNDHAFVRSLEGVYKNRIPCSDIDPGINAIDLMILDTSGILILDRSLLVDPYEYLLYVKYLDELPDAEVENESGKEEFFYAVSPRAWMIFTDDNDSLPLPKRERVIKFPVKDKTDKRNLLSLVERLSEIDDMLFSLSLRIPKAYTFKL